MPSESGGLGGTGGGRSDFPASELPAYVIAQVVGGIAAAGVLYVIASGKAGIRPGGGFASNGYGDALAGRILAGWPAWWPRSCSRSCS